MRVILHWLSQANFGSDHSGSLLVLRVFLSHGAAVPHTHHIKYETVRRGWERMRNGEPRKERSGWQPAALKAASPSRRRFVFAKLSRVVHSSDYKRLGLHQKISGCVSAVTPATPQNDVRALLSVKHRLWWNYFKFHEVILSGLMGKLQSSWIVKWIWDKQMQKMFHKEPQKCQQYIKYKSLVIKNNLS